MAASRADSQQAPKRLTNNHSIATAGRPIKGSRRRSNLTAYGGLLPVATMLEKLGFQQLVEEAFTVRRKTRAMPMADSSFYRWEAVQAYEKRNWRFIVVARKTARLVDELKAADWKRSPRTDADGQCEFLYQPDGWGKALPVPGSALRKEARGRGGGRTRAVPVV